MGAVHAGCVRRTGRLHQHRRCQLAKLLDSSPETLLLLSSRNRYLVLALGADVSHWSTGGRLAPDRAAFVVCHLIGRAYSTTHSGGSSSTSASRPKRSSSSTRLRQGRVVHHPVLRRQQPDRSVERHPPHAIPRLAALLAVGIIGRLAADLVAGATFEEELEDFVGWLQTYSWWLVGISVALVLPSTCATSARAPLALIQRTDGSSHPPRQPLQHERRASGRRFDGPALLARRSDLSEITADSLNGKKVVLNIFPSIDTPTCAASVRTFNAPRPRRHGRPVRVRGPAVRRRPLLRCRGHREREDGIRLPQLRSPRTTASSWPTAPWPVSPPGVVVLDADGIVVHTQLVGEIADEPDYDAALAALD